MFITLMCAGFAGAAITIAVVYFIQGNKHAAFGYLFLFIFNLMYVVFNH